MQKINAVSLKTMMEQGVDMQLIDIREMHEVATGNIGGQHIPMAEVKSRLGELRRDCPLIVHCRSGKRAKAMIHVLETEFGFSNLYLLEGGIQSWANDVDQNILVF